LNKYFKSIYIYNSLGEKILENIFLVNQNEIEFDFQGFQNGLYMIRLEDNLGNHYSEILSYIK